MLGIINNYNKNSYKLILFTLKVRVVNHVQNELIIRQIKLNCSKNIYKINHVLNKKNQTITNHCWLLLFLPDVINKFNYVTLFEKLSK